ncbi:MAG TPA: hypothetical protein VM490_07025 [Armatimonadaceae bacterium]|nr:hypothetical protein [Armatimonadaceae bacterium]
MTNPSLPTSDRVFDAMGTAPRSRGRQRKRHGRNFTATSLVEVLVVLVVLLIGIFAVIRIFPVGFGQLQQSERRLRADRLARNYQDQILGDAANLPESITFSVWDTGTNVLNTVTDQDPDDLGFYGGLTNPYFSDVNKFRFVRNEPVKIPLPSTTTGAYGGGTGSVYTLKFGPVYMIRQVGDPAAAPASAADLQVFNSYLRITGQPLVGVRARGGFPQATTRLRGPHTYLIDYGDDNDAPMILFPQVGKTVTYDVSYSYEDTTGAAPATATVIPVATQVTVTPAQAGVWQAMPGFTGGTGDTVQEGSDKVSRQFERLPVAASWSANDPYEYKLLSANVSDVANFGVVAFNPAGANYSERTPYGQRAFTALVSYAVLDWHILRDDREVPSAETVVASTSGTVGVATVRTTLPNIRPKNDESADGTIYQGLYGETTDTDIQVFNLEDPTGIPLRGGDYVTPLDDTNFDYWVRREGRTGTYQTGIIYLNMNRLRPGTPLRILYKAQGDWAVSIQKAAANYTYSGALRPTVNDAASFGVDANRLYFHRTELNKAAVATIEYDIDFGSGRGVESRRLAARQFTIGNAEGAHAWADMTQIAPEITGGNVVAWRIFGPVQGVSVKTRVIWKDNQTFRNPWRVQDLESIITQAPPTL